MFRRPATALLKKAAPAFKKFNTRFTKTALTAVGVAAVGATSYVLLQANSNNNNKEEFSLIPTAYAEEDELPQLKNVQPTVISGMHPQCAIVTIYLAPNANKKDVARAASKIDSLVQRLSPQEKKNQDEDDDTLPEALAGVGFSFPLWKALSGKQYPLYKARKGKYGEMPATGGDLILHVKASSRSLCHEIVEEFVHSLPEGSVARVEDNYGWKYRDGRDLSGFLDGTMNPGGVEDRYEAAVIPSTGGSFLIHQVWNHNLAKLRKMELAAQEAIVGRRKHDSAELTDLPFESHVARMRRNGKDTLIPIVRQSMPFGSHAGTNGLLFIAYANDLEKFDVMLDRMTGAHDDKHNDATMSFSTCVSGNYWYIPSKKELSSL